mgnify:CR=1 FL=1
MEKLIRAGQVCSDETVVVNCTGHTFPVEKHVLGDQWRVDIHLSDDQSPAPREGLQAALENLDEKTTTVLVVDDNPNDALPALLDAWADDDAPIACLVPEGVATAAIDRFLHGAVPRPGGVARAANLALAVVPFVDQAAFDRRLWSCDLDIVRGD